MKRVKVLIVDGMINSSIAAVIHQIAEDRGLAIIEDLSTPETSDQVVSLSDEGIVELWNSYFNPRLKSGQSGYVYMPAAMYHLLSNKLDIKSTLKAISMVKENSILDNKGKPCRVQLRKLTDLFLGGMPVLNGIVPLNNVEVAEPISRKESNRNAAGEIKDEKKETSKKKVAKKSKSSTKK